MKIKFWDILASLVMLAGLGLAVIFINIFVNPNTFLNPFPPPTPVASLDVATLTPSQPSLPELWSATPETPGVPSVTSKFPTGTLAATRWVWPSQTQNPYAYKTFTRTPNYALTAYYAFKTPTRTHTPSSDTTRPTDPGVPTTVSPTSDSTPTWIWAKSTDSGSGLNYYQVTWGGDVDCSNTVYVTSANSWTTPTITSNTDYFICVRARDKAGNYSNWVGPAGFYYSGPVGSPSRTSTITRTPTRTFTITRTPTRTSTNVVSSTFTITSTATNTLVVPPTSTHTLVPASTSTNTLVPPATATNTLVPPATATDTLVPPATSTYTLVPPPTSTDTLMPPPTSTDTLVPPPTSTDTLMPPPTATDTLIPPPTSTDTLVPVPTSTDTLIPVPTATDTLVPGPTETQTLTPLPSTYTITGNTGVGPTITPTGGPIPAVYITVTGDPGAIVTQPDAMGNYTVVVPANWSGKISPARVGYLFTPVNYTYANVAANVSGQSFTSAGNRHLHRFR